MKSWILAAACIAAVSGAARVVSQPVAAPTPLEAFGGLPTIEDAEISPDGKRLALIVTNGEQRRVIFEDLATSHVFASVASGDRKLRAIQWAGSDHLLITNSVTETVFALNGSKREWFLTTDYAVEIFHAALEQGRYTCFLREDQALPMMYMPDAIRATLQLMDAPAAQVKERGSYNLAGISFTPLAIAAAIRKRLPAFTMDCEPDFRQAIAESWPRSIDDSAAQRDWGWQPRYDLQAMADDMLAHLRPLLQAHRVAPRT